MGLGLSYTDKEIKFEGKLLGLLFVAMDTQLDLVEQSFNLQYSLWAREALDELTDNFTITDPSISGHPIVFASRGFLKMSGYSRDEVIGRNGRIFQGPKTNRRSVMEVREAIREERSVQVSILNYRKDGAPLRLLLHVCPVFDRKDGRVTNFVAVQVPLSRRSRRRGSGGEFGRNGVHLYDEHRSGFRDVFLGSCRREVCSDSVVESGCALAMDSVLGSDDRGLEVDEPCEASELEKRKAVATINNILSVLTHYSELTGRLVCGKRCCISGVASLSSALNISLGRIKQSFVLTDACLHDMPIIYASDKFLDLTGYARQEVLGRNCRFLGGVDTDSSTTFQIKESIQREQPCTVRILNYRKDKSPFWNFLHISPVRNASGKVAYFVGVQIDESNTNQDRRGMSPEMRQLSVVGAVKVAVRSLSMGTAGTSRS